jgi:hypothetical protein
MTARVKKIGKTEKAAAGLEEECARLRSELARVTEERDGYLKSLHFMLRKEYPLTPFDDEELATMVEVDLTEIKQELRQLEKACQKPQPSNTKSAGPRKTVKP